MSVGAGGLLFGIVNRHRVFYAMAAASQVSRQSSTCRGTAAAQAVVQSRRCGQQWAPNIQRSSRTNSCTASSSVIVGTASVCKSRCWFIGRYLTSMVPISTCMRDDCYIPTRRCITHSVTLLNEMHGRDLDWSMLTLVTDGLCRRGLQYRKQYSHGLPSLQPVVGSWSPP